MQFRLRTLLILLAVLPPVLAGAWAGPTVVAVMLGFLAFVACLAAVGVMCAMGLESIADAVIDPWQKRKS